MTKKIICELLQDFIKIMLQFVEAVNNRTETQISFADFMNCTAVSKVNSLNYIKNSGNKPPGEGKIPVCIAPDERREVLC